MATRRKKHRVAVQVGENEAEFLRIVLPRQSTVRDLAQAVQERLRKKQKTGKAGPSGHEAPLVVTEIREKLISSGVGAGGASAGGTSHGVGLKASTLELDEDDTLSDLMESDTEASMFVAMIDEDGGKSAPSPRRKVATEASEAADVEMKSTNVVPKRRAGADSGKEKSKAEVPHRISYTVAGMPRNASSGDHAGNAALDRRGPRRGSVAAFTTWNLRDLKRAIARAEDVPFTPDKAASSSRAIMSNIKVTVSPGITVPISVSNAETIRDLWHKVAHAARAAKEEQEKVMNDSVDNHDAIVAAATSAAAAAANDQQDDDNDEDGEGICNVDDARFPHGKVLIRQKAMVDDEAGSSRHRPTSVARQEARLLSRQRGGANGVNCFLDVADKSIGFEKCDVREGEELVLVGPGSVSSDDIPSWMVRVRVLGQPLGCISIPNRRLETAQKGESDSEAEKSGGGVGRGIDGVVRLQTLGDLREHLANELGLPSKRMEIWISSPEVESSAIAFDAAAALPGKGDGRKESSGPRGERAIFDKMSLGHYGLCHLGAVDVRLSPEPESAPGVTTEADAGGEQGDSDMLGIRVATHVMRARGEKGVEIFISKSSFSLALVKGLACRALGVSVGSIRRMKVANTWEPIYTTMGGVQLSKYDIRNGSSVVLHLDSPLTGSIPRRKRDEGSSEEEASTRTSVALWAEEPSECDDDCVTTESGASGGPLSTMVYPLRSTAETDAVELGEWGLLRDNVHVYAVFYNTTSPVSAVVTKLSSNRYANCDESSFGTAPCWRSRPVPASSAGDRRVFQDEDKGIDEGIWDEENEDSDAGMACLLSSLHVMSTHLSSVKVSERFEKELEGRDTAGWLMRELTALLCPRFPPAALALFPTDNIVTDAERACLAQCLWGLAREIVPSSVPDRSVFEHARIVLAWLLSRSSNAREDANRDASRQASIQKRAGASGAGAEAAAAGGGSAVSGPSECEKVEANVRVEIVSLRCCRLEDRVERGHAVRLRVQGRLLPGIYSRGGALEKEEELRREFGADESMGDAAESVPIELVPWEQADRLLLATSSLQELGVLRLKHPSSGVISGDGVGVGFCVGSGDGEKREDPASWLSLLDWRTVVEAVGRHSWARVIAPLSLLDGKSNCLTRDRNGHMAVFTGRTKSTTRSLVLFSPLKGGTRLEEDAHVLAQALSMLAKTKGGLPGEGFDFSEASTRVALEGIVVCLDSSFSMGGRPGFEDDEHVESDEDNCYTEKKKKELVFNWSDPQYSDIGGINSDSDIELMWIDGEEEDVGGYAQEMRRAELKENLRKHPCLAQLQEVACQFERGSYPPLEHVLEELVLEKFDPDKPQSWEDAERDMKVYRRYRQEFVDILIKEGKVDARDSTSSTGDVSEWAPPQFICPITQGLMMDPVVAVDGHSYERHAVLQWFGECQRNGRPISSPMSGAVMKSEIVTSNHALKSRIQDWLESSQENRSRSVGSSQEGGATQGRGDGSSGSFHDAVNVKIEVRYGSKSREITIDRSSNAEGIKRLQILVARWKALGIFNPGSSGSGEGAIGRVKRAFGLRATSASTDAVEADVKPTVSPNTIKLIHGGQKLTRLWTLKEGDVVMALDVENTPSSSFTIRIKQSIRSDVYMLARKDETAFSIKLRLWAQRVNRRPSRTALWHGLKPVGDGVTQGMRMKNRDVPPPPPLNLPTFPIWPELRGNGSGDDDGSGDGDGIGDDDGSGDGDGIGDDDGSGDGNGDGDGDGVGDDDGIGDDGSGDGNGDGDGDRDDYGGSDDSGVSVLNALYYDPFRIGRDSRPSLTRLDAVKQLFHAFINRTQAYDIPVEVGLVSFGSEVKVACKPSPLLEEFRTKVDGLKHAGDTRLWDALQMACTLLERWRAEWLNQAKKRQAAERLANSKTEGDRATIPTPTEKEPVLRVVVFSDGDDTKSSAKAHSVCLRLQTTGIVVDSITIGTERNERLKCLSLATGGYAFRPKTLRESLRLNELETVLSSRVRANAEKSRGPAVELVRSEAQLLSAKRRLRAHDTEETATFKEDPRIKNICRPLVAAIAELGPADVEVSSRDGGGKTTETVVHPERSRRVRREMMDMMKNPHQAFEVFPSNVDMCFWKVLLIGPDSTPYRRGCWMLSVYFPPRYPSVAPNVRFVTPIRHCNINAHGRVCHALLDRSWTPNTSVSAVLGCVYGLLLYPDHDDPLDSTLALQMYDSTGEYEAAIMDHVKVHASKQKEMWEAELETAGMTPKERLARSRATLDEANGALALGRFEEAMLKAWIAAIYSAGGPAPIEAAPLLTGEFPSAVLGMPNREDEALNAVRSAAYIVVAWAKLKGPSPNLREAASIAANARFYNGCSPDVSRCLSKIAEMEWRQSLEGSVEAVAHLKEAIKQLVIHMRMTDRGSRDREESKDHLKLLKNSLELIDPSWEARGSYAVDAHKTSRDHW